MIKSLSTTGQLQVNRWFRCSVDLHRISLVRTFEETFRTSLEDEGRLFTGRIDPTASRPTQPRPSSPARRAPPWRDRPVVCAGFRFDRLMAEFLNLQCCKKKIAGLFELWTKKTAYRYSSKSFSYFRNIFCIVDNSFYVLRLRNVCIRQCKRFSKLK